MKAFFTIAIIQQLIIIIGVLTFLSCKKPKIESLEQGISFKIENSSGDDFSFGTPENLQYFAPYPFNHGIVINDGEKYEVMLVSKSINRGKKVNIKPLGKMTLSNADKSDTQVVVAVPIDKSLQIVQINDFYDFSVKQFNLKQLVEYWYSNRYGLNGSVVKGWEPVNIDDFIANN